MPNGEAEQPEVNWEIQIPPEEEGGRYANFVSVWHTPHEFTLDFAATQPAQPLQGGKGTGADGVTVPARVVARIRIPPTLLFDVLQTLNANLARYEENFGEIRRFEEEDE